MTNFETLANYLEKNFPKQHSALLSQRNDVGWEGLTIEDSINMCSDSPWYVVYKYVGISCYGRIVSDRDDVLDAISSKDWEDLQ